jgi:mono/diheme cytochrome c family protein
MRPLRPLVWCLLLAGCGSAEPGWSSALQRMKQQPRYDVYEGSAFFRDGKVMQAPPAGTVSRERMLHPAAPAETPELLALGRSRFRIFCGACHGVGGYGGSVVAANMTERRPPSLRTPIMTALPDTVVYAVIRDGFGRMPPYAAQLTERERWAVLAWLRQLQRTPTAAADERADSLQGVRLRAVDSARAAPWSGGTR